MPSKTHAAKTTPETAPAPAIEAEPLVTADHVAGLIHMHKRTVALHAQRGTLPSYKIGSSIRFRMSEIWEAIKREGATAK
jgi:hypothetical protein